MNIFATEQGILGDTGYARQHNTFHAFLTLARSIRKQLGAQAYKLDEYIRQLLIACSIPLEEEFFDRDASPTDALAASCRAVAKGESTKCMRANACYSIVRAYAQDHPLQNQVDNTRSLIYFCTLLDDHLATGMETMIQDIWSDTAGRMDTVLADALFQEICALLGQEEEMPVSWRYNWGSRPLKESGSVHVAPSSLPENLPAALAQRQRFPAP